jgi:phospholipid/cholesterol/gamma-HCH transport system substrate-binding protein
VTRGRDLMLVGVFVIGAGAVLVGSLLWLAGANVFRRVDRYEVVFDRSVSGLTPGASVEYQGVIIGRVQDVRLTDDIPPRVSVAIDVEPGTAIQRDTTAELVGSLVTGIKWIALQGGTEAAGPLEKGGTIPGDVTSFEELSNQVVEIGTRVLSILENLDKNVFTAENNARLSSFITDVSVIATDLRRTIEPFSKAHTGEKVADAVEHVGAAAQNLDQLMASLRDRKVIGDVDDTLASIQETAIETRELIRAVREELGGTGGALTGLINQLAIATQRLEETLTLIQSDPSLLLRGRKATGSDLP